MTAYYRTLQNASDAAIDMAISAGEAQVNLEQIPKTSKAAAFGMKALSFALNMAAQAAIMLVVNGLIQLSQVSDEVAQKAQELGSSFSDTKTDLENYKTQIEELQATINDSESSYEDVTTARKNLLSIQDELIEKYGDEKDTINLITDAINGQTDALNTLTEAQWQATKNEFNESGFLNNVANGIDGYSNNIDRMLGEYEGYSVSIDMSKYGGTLFTEGREEFEKMLQEEFGAIQLGSSQTFTLSGDVSEVREKLLDIQDILKENSTYKPDDIFSDYLGGLERSADDVIEKYEDFYKQYVLYEEIFTNDTFTDSYKKINDAYSEYQEALATGDKENIKKAQDNFANILAQATEGVSDESIVDFFNDMYPELQEAVNNWNFNVKFNASLEDDEESIKAKLQNAGEVFGTDENIKNYNPAAATNEQTQTYQAYLALQEIIDETGLSMDQLINKMLEMDYVSSQIKEDLLNKFAPNYKDAVNGSISDFDIDLNNGVNSIVVADWVEKLTDEETKLALSKEFENALEERKKQLNGATLAAEDYEKALQKVKDAQNENKNSVLSKSGMIDKISTELTDGFDILDEIYADVKDGETFDFSKLASDKFTEAFKGLEDEYSEFIETVSSSPNDLNACQGAFNKLTTAFINQSGILNELSDENASVTASYLKLMGVENAEIVVEDLLVSKREYLAVTGKKLEDATYEQIDAFIDEKDALEGEGVALDETSQKAVAYWMQKELISETPFSTLEDISQLDKLCGALGIASKAWRNYLYFKQLASMTDVYGEELTAEYAKKAESFFAEAQGDIQELLFGSNTFKYSGADKSNKSNKSSDSTDKHLEAYNKALKELQDKLKQELITERQFYDESEKLLNQYLKDTPAHIEKYKEEIADAETTLHGDWVNAFEAEKSALEGLYNDGAIPQKEYLARLKQIIEAYYVSGDAVNKYGKFTKEAAEQQRAYNDLLNDFRNNAFDGISLMLDKVISKYEKQQEAAEKAYEAQEKAIDVQIEQLDEQIDAINKQIDAVDKVIEAKQKEIDKIQEANDEINKQIQYQKNLAALEEAQNNKSVAVLKGGKVGYDIDHSAVKDAREAVRQDEEQKRIDAIEKEIKLLEERKESYQNEIELIELQKESLEKQQEAIQKMSEQSNEYFEKLIDSIEKYQSRFIDLQSIYQDAQIIDGMKGFLESIGTTPEQILNMSEDAFNKVKESYMKYVQDMSQNNESLMDSLNKTFQLNNIEGFEDFMKRAVDSVGLMGEIDLSSTTDGLGEVSESLGVVGETANSATASISTAGIEDEESPASLTGAIGTAYTTASETLPIVSGMMDGIATSANNAAAAVNNLASAIANVNSMSGSGNIPGFAKGSERIPKDMNAWTQEDGAEFIASPSRRAVYTPLKEGDSVFTAEMTKNLWQWAKLTPNLAMVNQGLPSASAISSPVVSNYDSNHVNNTFEFNITMPNVTDSSQAQELVNELHSLATAKFRFFNKRR